MFLQPLSSNTNYAHKDYSHSLPDISLQKFFLELDMTWHVVLASHLHVMVC